MANTIKTVIEVSERKTGRKVSHFDVWSVAQEHTIDGMMRVNLSQFCRAPDARIVVADFASVKEARAKALAVAHDLAASLGAVSVAIK